MMTAWVLESALRSLMMATVVWTGVKVLRAGNVLVQKTVWSLVLFSALAMPALMRWHLLQPKSAVVVPVRRLLPEMAITPASTTNITVFPAITQSVMTERQAAAPVKHWPLAQWKAFIAPAYLLVCAILLLRLFVGLALAFRIWHRAEPASVLLDPRANVRISGDIQTPVTIGSSIILPVSHIDWDQHKLRMVLAHERSHVRQGDFYLQLIAGIHAALFWFSPLSWWLKKEISDLGEAISDRAALDEAQSRATYAEVLMEFAAMPRRPLAGVAMARSSNIRRRVDRLLIEQKFRSAFTTCRWHLTAAAALVPVALVVAVALVRVQTAEAMQTSEITMPQIRIVTPAMAVAPVAAVAPVRAVANVAQTDIHEVNQEASPEPVPPAQAKEKASHSSSYLHISDDDQNSYAIVSGDSTNMSDSGHFGEAFDKAKGKLHGNYILFERDGRTYVIDDPALVEQSQQLFKPVEELGRRQGELGEQQGRLGEEQGRLGEQQASASAPAPDMSKEIAELQEELKKLQEHRQEMKETDLSGLQASVGALQGRIGDIQAKIGEKQAEFGSQQARLGEQQAKLGSQQAELGAQQAKLSEEASRKMKSLIDSAMQNGKARPVE